jgi:DDE family transposase
MHHFQSTVRPAVVHAYARHLLLTDLELRDYKQSLPAGLLASVLLLCACWQCSLSAACQLTRGTPSRETARKALFACLPPRPRDLLDRVVRLLHDSLPEHLGRRPLPFVLDLHRRPYYGKSTRGTSRGQEKKSTKKAFAYATLAVLSPEGRFTVGLLPFRQYMRLTTVLRRLLAQAAEAGLSISYLMVDQEFYSAEVIAWLKRHGVAFLMPAKRRDGKKGNGWLYAATTQVGWYEYSWTSRPRRHDFKTGQRARKKGLVVTVAVRMCVARHPKKEGERLVYASWGLSKWSPATVVAEYRRRFNIEVTYRQLGQCLAVTTSRDERVRLLLVGVALLPCNVWAYLHAEVFSRGALGERRLHLSLCRLRQLCRDLAEAIATTLGGTARGWPAQRPLPARLAAFADAA